MSNIIPFGQGQVPAYVNSFFGEDESNIAPKLTIPALSFRGKACASCSTIRKPSSPIATASRPRSCR